MPLPVGSVLRKVAALDLQLPPLAREEMIPAAFPHLIECVRIPHTWQGYEQLMPCTLGEK